MKQIIFILLAVFALLFVSERAKLAEAANSLIQNTTLRYTEATTALDTLTAPGYFKPVGVKGYSQITIAFCDSLLGNTAVAIRVLGKIKGASPISWGNLDAENDSLVIAATGTTYRAYDFPAALDSIKVQIITEGGGATAKYWLIFKLANPSK